MPTLRNLLNQASNLDSREALLLLAHATGKPESFIKTHETMEADDKTTKLFLDYISRRLNHEPVAYIVGSQPFCGLNFYVDSRVLIPRPETETLAEIVASDIGREVSGDKKIVVLDIGTGSGCIACSIAKRFGDALVIASDNSPATLSVVKYNDRMLSTGIKIIHSDLIGTQMQQELRKIFSAQESVTLFAVANLPYLPYRDADDMQKDVYGYEPKNALFANDDGMALIKKCIQQFKSLIFPYCKSDDEWALYFEIDPEQADKLKEFVKSVFEDKRIQIKKDLCGRDRFLIIS
ncbi:peptide chain release factor N(5)-glutamine methyltransferase [Candidatus Uhrbacteria bacterium]|nr:peptide chain release factor N(5)-glutamine methyltransferase [Candidatus Uhrbacteria bacterium]